MLQFQTPIFSLNSKGAWTLRFDDILADALELEPLQNYEVTIPEEIPERQNHTGTCRYRITDAFRL